MNASERYQSRKSLTYREAWEAIEFEFDDPFGNLAPQRERVGEAIEAVERVRKLCAEHQHGGGIHDSYLWPADVLRALDGEA